MPRLTKRAVESIPPGARPLFAWDDQLAGFGVKVLPSGKRQYIVKYRVGGGRTGRQRWFLVGSHGAVTCEQARELAQQALAEVARGSDPQLLREARRAAPTVAELWERYRREHLPKKKASSAANDIILAERYLLPAVRAIKVEDIARADISRLHHQLSSTPYQANRLLALVSKMFNLAELWGYRPDGSNPTRHIGKYPEKARQRFLTLEEVARVSNALDELVSEGGITLDMAAAIRLLLLTGARLNEILTAEWAWVNWKTRTIELPDSKTGAKPIFLSDQALAVLRSLHDRPALSPNKYVIRGRLKGSGLINLQKPWARICERAQVSGVRIHDLRHTAASVGVASGLTLPLIGRLLGHTQVQTTQRYAHVDTDPALLAANAIGRALSEAVGSKIGSDNDSESENL